MIALIEDDPLLRGPTAYSLQQAGFDVVAAASGAEGLMVLDDRHIDVAVVDVILPGRMTGLDMLKEARRRNPDLKVVLTSGKPLPDEVRDIGPFLPKPVRLIDLIDVLRTVMGSSTVPSIDPAASRSS